MGKQCSFLIGWGTCHAPAVRDSSREGVGRDIWIPLVSKARSTGPVGAPSGRGRGSPAFQWALATARCASGQRAGAASRTGPESLYSFTPGSHHPAGWGHTWRGRASEKTAAGGLRGTLVPTLGPFPLEFRPWGCLGSASRPFVLTARAQPAGEVALGLGGERRSGAGFFRAPALFAPHLLPQVLVVGVLLCYLRFRVSEFMPSSGLGQPKVFFLEAKRKVLIAGLK